MYLFQEIRENKTLSVLWHTIYFSYSDAYVPWIRYINSMMIERSTIIPKQFREG